MELTLYYLMVFCYQGILCVFFIVQLGRVNPYDPRSACFRRSLYGVVTWAFFDFLITLIRTHHSHETALSAYRHLSFLFLIYPPLGFELILSLIRRVTWKIRFWIYAPYGFLYLTALFAPQWLNARMFGVRGGYEGTIAPWNLAFKCLTLLLAVLFLGLLFHNSRKEGDSTMKREKRCLFYGGVVFLGGIVLSQILKLTVPGDLPWFANLFSSALSFASFISIRYFGRVLSPEMLYEATLKIIPGGIFHLRDRRITWYNDGLKDLLGDLPDPVSQNFILDDILAPVQDKTMSPDEILAHLSDPSGQGTVVVLKRKTGETITCMGASAPINRSSPEKGHVVLLTDISRRVAMEKALQKANRILEAQANNDALTGIANRRRFDTILPLELKRIRRIRSSLSLIMIDIDHFKRYNDYYGHQEGDACLRAIAKAIDECADRSGDLTCRYGGEEIAVILPDTPLDGGVTMAKKIQRAISSLRIPHATSPVDTFVTCSMGISTLRSDDDPLERNVINEADEALYQAKAQGRNRIALSRHAIPPSTDSLPEEKDVS